MVGVRNDGACGGGVKEHGRRTGQTMNRSIEATRMRSRAQANGRKKCGTATLLYGYHCHVPTSL